MNIPMKKAVLEGTIFGLLVCGAVVAWGLKTGWFHAGESAPTVVNTKATAKAKAADPAASAKKTAERANVAKTTPWVTRQPALVETDLVVLPTTDRTGLLGSLNFEIRETSGRMIQAMMDLGGRPVTCPESWPLYASLDRNGYSFNGMKPLDDATLAKLGKELKTKTIVQVELTWETDKTVARAKAVEVGSGRLLGRWEASLPGTSRSYEALFNVQCALAPKVAAGLIGIPVKVLLSGNPGNAAPPADRQAARDLSDQALSLFDPCTYPHAMTALRMALDALKHDKRCIDAWMVVAFATRRLAERAEDTQTAIWREMMLRSLVAGETAVALAPANPKAQFARACSLLATGRNAELVDMMRKAVDKAPPDDWLTRSAAALYFDRTKDFPKEPQGLTPGEKALYNYFVSQARLSKSYDERQATLEKWLQIDPLAPYLWYDWGYKGLNQMRYGHTFCSIQGSVLTLCESLRQLELHGKTDAIPTVFQDVGPEFLKMVKETANDNNTSGSMSPRADDLKRQFRTWVAKEEQEAWQSIGWESNSIAIQLLKAGMETRRKTLAVLGTPMPLVRGPGGGVNLSSPLWLDLAARPALDGAKESFADIGWRYSDEESALAMAKQALQAAPDDLGLLEELCYYYRSVHFNPGMVDLYQRRMWGIDSTYGPLLWRSATFKQGTLKDKIDAFERLKYYGPFNYPTLAFIVKRLDSLGADDQAADYAKILLLRYPLAYDFRFRELTLRAVAQKRLITDQEIKEVVAKIPEDYKGRDLSLADAYRHALDLDKAIPLYEKVIQKDSPHDTTIYYNVAWLHELKGEPDKAVDDLMNYIKIDPHSLAACDVWLEISWIRYAHGDLKRAEEDLQQAEAIDNWKQSVILRRAFMEFEKGNVNAAFSEYQRSARRYPGQFSYAQMGWACFADKKMDQAMKWVMAGFQAGTGSDVNSLRSWILTAQGKDQEARQALLDYNSRMNADADPQILLAMYHLYYGNYDEALACAHEAVRRCIYSNRLSALNILAFVYIKKGELQKAEELAREIRARSPLDLISDYLFARIELARNNPQKALRILDRSVKARTYGGLHLAAKIEFQEGKYQQAYDHVKLGNSMMLNPSAEWLLLEGDAAKALGKTDEARKAWKYCVDTGGPNTVFGKLAAKRLAGTQNN